MRVGIVRDPIYLEHVMDDFHPESPKRLMSIYAMLDGLDQKDLVCVTARAATEEEIEFIHEPSYVSTVRATQGLPHRRLDPDTSTSPQSYEAALMAAGGVLRLIDARLAGQVDNGFALVRPPGHHAESGRAMGFCIFNNIAIGARYLELRHGVKRILIMDFDLHHGNGTQHSFYDSPSVLYMSTHQYPFYPGTGWYDEVGQGPGKGFTVNVPLSGGMGDTDYIQVFRDVVVPIADRFRPEFVLVSAGFDIHKRDPLGSMAVTESGFGEMAKILIDLAARTCEGRIVFVLEGGYDLTGLTDGVEAVLMELRATPLAQKRKMDAPSNAVIQTISKVKREMQPYWADF
jgi:acetoin utilization deacetylase AcuC-like enzyme